MNFLKIQLRCQVPCVMDRECQLCHTVVCTVTWIKWPGVVGSWCGTPKAGVSRMSLTITVALTLDQTGKALRRKCITVQHPKCPKEYYVYTHTHTHTHIQIQQQKSTIAITVSISFQICTQHKQTHGLTMAILLNRRGQNGSTAWSVASSFSLHRALNSPRA